MIIPYQLRNQRFIKVDDAKRPIEKAWQQVGGANYGFDDKDFLKWVEHNKRYGILCGYPNNLVVIDFDNEDVQREALDTGLLIPTFSQKTARKGLLHLFYYTDDPTSWKVLDKEKNTLADIQGTTKQVIGPNTVIADGRKYNICDDLPIATLSMSIIHRVLDKFDYGKQQELLVKTSEELTLDDFNKPSKIVGEDKALSEIRSRLKISDILRDKGISTSRNPTQCPFHSSKGGKCLGFDDAKGIWSCFHCSEKGTAIDLWMKIRGVSDFVDAKKQLCVEFGIEDNYVAPPMIEPSFNNLPNVQLPQDNITIGDFSKDLAKHFNSCTTLFWKVDEKSLCEVTEYYDNQLRQLVVEFGNVTPSRLLNLIEEKVNTYNLVKVKKQEVLVRKSANEQTIKLVSTNTDFIKALFKIKRLLNYPLPFMADNNTLIIPSKGYDEKYQAYFTPNTPELTLMSVDNAKSIINDILKEFCFKEDIDLVMAIAYLITPMCRGIYKSSNARTPLFIIQANRERAGKDYLAGVVGILYEGRAIDDTPFVTGDKSESNNEEWRKKLTSILKSGRRRIHSSNNRGYLNSAVMEQFLTSEVWTDRQLGGNITLALSNEVDVSLSANIGLTYTADLWYRARPINLFYGEEDPNSRTYTRTDLWGYVREHRGILLSAIYTLIKEWYDAGRPGPTTPFTSFPEWARVVGGIMCYHKIGDPCIRIEDDGIGGDKETQSMKELFTFMADYAAQHKEVRGYTISDLRRLVVDATSSEDFEGFAGWDFQEKSTQTKFGITVRRFVNRSFSCDTRMFGNVPIKLIIAVSNNKSVRILYNFTSEVHDERKVDKRPKKVTPPPKTPLEKERVMAPDQLVEENLNIEEPVYFLNSGLSQIEFLHKVLLDNGTMAVHDLIISGVLEDTILKAMREGKIYSPKSGYVGLI